MRVRYVAVGVTALVWLLAACGGAGDAAPVTGRLPVGTLAPMDRENPGASSQTDSAHAQSTETAVTLTEDDIRSGFDDIVSMRVACGRDPWSCDLGRIAVVDSPTYTRLQRLLESRRTGGIVAGARGGFRYRIDDVDIDAGDHSTQVADVSVCATDDTVLVDENGWVFDDGLFSGRMVFTMHRVDGEWRWFDDRTDTYTYGEDMCGLLA